MTAALRGLSASAGALSAMLERPALKPLMTAMSRHVSNEAIAFSVCSMLYRLALVDGGPAVHPRRWWRGSTERRHRRCLAARQHRPRHRRDRRAGGVRRRAVRCPALAASAVGDLVGGGPGGTARREVSPSAGRCKRRSQCLSIHTPCRRMLVATTRRVPPQRRSQPTAHPALAVYVTGSQREEEPGEAFGTAIHPLCRCLAIASIPLVKSTLTALPTFQNWRLHCKQEVVGKQWGWRS